MTLICIPQKTRAATTTPKWVEEFSHLQKKHAAATQGEKWLSWDFHIAHEKWQEDRVKLDMLVVCVCMCVCWAEEEWKNFDKNLISIFMRNNYDVRGEIWDDVD